MGPYSIWICVYLYMKTLGKNHPLICTVNVSQPSFHGDPCPGIGFSKNALQVLAQKWEFLPIGRPWVKRFDEAIKKLGSQHRCRRACFFFRMLASMNSSQIVCLYASIIELCQSFSLEWTSRFVDVIWHWLVVAILIYFGHQYFNTPHATPGHRKNGRLLSFTCQFVYWLALFCMGCIPDFAHVQLHKIL